MKINFDVAICVACMSIKNHVSALCIYFRCTLAYVYEQKKLSHRKARGIPFTAFPSSFPSLRRAFTTDPFDTFISVFTSQSTHVRSTEL